jgi:hypothetical protein
MSKREDEAYAAWLEELIAEYPDELRDKAKEALSSPVARERLYRGTIRQDDYYRRLNEIEDAKKELESARDELYAWYEEESPKQEVLITERDLLKKQLADRAGDPPAAAGVPGFSIEDLAVLKAKAEKIEVLDKIIPAVLADSMAIAKDAVKNNFEYDPHEVMRLSLQHGVEPYKAYEHLTSDQRRKRYEKEQEDEKKKWVEEGRRQALTARNGSPDQLPISGPSIFNTLAKKDAPESTQRSRVDAALAAMLDMKDDGSGLS